MSEHLTPQLFSEDEPKPSPGKPKTADYSVRLSRDVRSGTGRSLLGAGVRRSQPDPSLVMGELPQNTSTSVTTMAEYLAPELIQRHFP